MPGTPKKGLDYAGWATDIFDNESSPIDELLDSQGWVGFGIYFFLCQRAYKTDGYFYRWNYNNASSTARKMGGGVKSETVKQVVSLCLQIGLFDKGLFDREGILTNRMIQERFMLAMEKRSQSARTTNGKYWLLKSEETKAYIVIPENPHSIPENAHSLPENAHSLPENDTKESKGKEKEKESKLKGREKGASPLTPEQEKLLCEEYGKANVAAYKDKLARWKAKRNIKSCNEFELLARWLNEDKPPVKQEAKAESSFNTEELDRIAFERYKENKENE